MFPNCWEEIYYLNRSWKRWVILVSSTGGHRRVLENGKECLYAILDSSSQYAVQQIKYKASFSSYLEAHNASWPSWFYCNGKFTQKIPVNNSQHTRNIPLPILYPIQISTYGILTSLKPKLCYRSP
jgi:hypothetical protein